MCPSLNSLLSLEGLRHEAHVKLGTMKLTVQLLIENA